MPLTILDSQTALIVVDLQKGLRDIPSLHPIAGVIYHSCQLVEAFRKQKLPVILVNVTGTAPGRTEEHRRHRELPADFSELIPELPQQPDDILITKRTWGAFANTDLEAQLKAKGVTQVVLTGVATGTGVEATARQAYEAGFNVTLAADAVTDVRAEAHEYSLKHVFPRLGETGSTQDVLDLLAKEALNTELATSRVLLLWGSFLANAIPHFVSGMMGRPFQSPLAKPPGKGLSSSALFDLSSSSISARALACGCVRSCLRCARQRLSSRR